MQFCSRCGFPLETREIEQRQRLFCSQCRHVYYEQLKVGAGAYIEQDRKLLLFQRTKAPFERCWNLPAGYVEVDESPEQAIVREVREEVGLQVRIADLAGVYFFDDDSRGNGILIVYRCVIVGGKLAESSESVQPTFFAHTDIPLDLAGGGHNQAISDWQKSQISDI